MPLYSIKGPDGKTYSIEGPAGASKEDVVDAIMHRQQEAETAQKEHLEKTGFMPALKAAGRGALGATEEYLGEKFNSPGLLSAAEEQKQKAASTYEPTTAADIAQAKGILPTASRMISKYVTEPVGGVAGRFGVPIAAGAAAVAAAPEELALSPFLVSGAATSLANLPTAAGENIQRQKEVGAPVDTAKAELYGIAQSILAGFVPFGGKVNRVIGPQLMAEADRLAPAVIEGTMTKEAAAQALSSKAQAYLRATGANAVTGSGLMVGTEALTRGAAGQDLASEDALNAYKEQAQSALAMAPLFGAIHPTGRGEALAKLGDAESRYQDIGRINQERAQREMDIIHQNMANKEAPPAAEAPPVEEAPVEEAPVAPSTTLDKATLNGIGLRTNTNAFKALMGVDIATPEGRKLFEETLDANQSRVKEDKINELLASLPKPETEATDATIRPESGQTADRASVQTSDERTGAPATEGTPENIAGTVGTAGVDVGQSVGRTEPSTVALGDIVQVGGVNYRKTENGFERVEESTAEAKKPEEVAKDEAPAVADEAHEVAKKLFALDPTHPLMSELRAYDVNKATIDEAKAEIAALKEARKAKEPVKPSELRELSEEQKAAESEPNVEDARPVPDYERIAPGITKLADETEGHKTFGETLTHMKDNYDQHLTEDQKVLIDKLQSIKSVANAKYALRDVPSYHPHEGSYYSIFNRIEMRRDAIDPVVTLLHEGVHAATVHVVSQHVRAENAGKPFEETYTGKTESGKLLATVFEQARKAAEKNTGFAAVTGKHNAFKNIREFIAEVYTNEKFQKFLASQASVHKGKYASLWSDFVRAVKGMLGVKDVSDSMLSDAIAGSHELFSEKPARGERVAAVSNKNREVEPNAELAKLHEEAGGKKTDTEKPASAFQSMRDDPAHYVAEKKKGLQHFLDNLETQYFSSDAGLSKAIRRGIQSTGASWETIKKLMHQVSTSQALHAEGVAHRFLEMGGIRYNPELMKFETFEDTSGSWKGTIDAIKMAADAHGVPYSEMEQYAHKALEARRLKLDVIPFNERLRAKEDALVASGKKTQIQADRDYEANAKEIHMTDAQIAAGMKFFDKIPQLDIVVSQWDETRKKVINFAVDTGLYTLDKAETLMDTLAYVPFFRVEQLENRAGPKDFSRGLLDAATDKRFKGSHQEVNNVFDNMERWTSYMIRKGINNKSAQNLTKAAIKYLPDEVRTVDHVAHGMRENTFSIWEHGQKTMYEFKDPMFVHAFTGMESVAIPALKGFAWFTNALRQNIVLNPLFSVGQLSQDAFGAMLSSGLKHPFAIPLEVMREFTKTLGKGSTAHEELKNLGAVGLRDYSATASRVDAEIAAGLKAPTLTQKIKAPFEKLSMASDNAVRQAIYNRTLLETGGKRMADGRISGGDKATATERAFEIINFRRSGASQNVALLQRTVPFFGAYLQSMNVAMKVLSGRGISPTEKAEAYKVLAANVGKVLALGFVYNSVISEDEGYKKLDPTVRDRMLVIPGTNGVTIPLRSDVFTLLAKIIPEHMYQMTMAEETEDSTKAKKAIGHAVANAILSPNVMPQAIKPLFEVSLNKNLWTGQPIVGQGQELLETPLQFGPSTSELAKAVGSTGIISPLNFDYLMKSYFGYTGGMVLQGTDVAIAQMKGETIPDKSTQDMIASIPGMSTFVSKEFGTHDTNDFYELKALTNKAVATMNKLKEIGTPEEVQAYREENQPLITANKRIERIANNLTKIKKQERQVQADNDLTAEEKKDRLFELETREHQMISTIADIRKTAGL